MNNILRIEDLTMQFGGVVAVNNLCLDVNVGEIVSLIGPNGAGKTTVFNTITGVYTPTNGRIDFCGTPMLENYPRGKMKKLYAGDKEKIHNNRITKSPDEITKLGIARTFQNIRLFKSMTVMENVLTAMHVHRKSNIFTATLNINYKEEREFKKRAEELLNAVGLYEYRNNIATSLPYGKQRHLEFARALATSPKLLLLDEPAAGMNPQETESLTEFIYSTRDRFNVTIFLIEHHMNMVMDISDRIYVIDFGKQIATGTPEEIQTNQRVIDAYLGVSNIG